MLRAPIVRIFQAIRKISLGSIQRLPSPISEPPGDEDLQSYADLKFERYFKRPEIDGWEIRKGMNDILGMDMVPYPTTINAALQACRRVNDFALAIRWIEGVCHKCGGANNKVWRYISQEIRPCLDELGISTLEELSFDKPKLALKTVFD